MALQSLHLHLKHQRSSFFILDLEIDKLFILFVAQKIRVNCNYCDFFFSFLSDISAASRAVTGEITHRLAICVILFFDDAEADVDAEGAVSLVGSDVRCHMELDTTGGFMSAALMVPSAATVGGN